MANEPMKAVTGLTSLGGVAGLLTTSQGRELLVEASRDLKEAVRFAGAHGGLGFAGLASTSHGRVLITEDLMRAGVTPVTKHELQLPEITPSNPLTSDRPRGRR